MGSSPKNSSGPPPNQGPPIEQLRPAQPPPQYTQFLPGAVDANTGQMPMATGLTPEMLASISANNSQTAPPPMSSRVVEGAGPQPRDPLVQLLAAMLQQQPQKERQFGSSGGGYGGGNSIGGGRSSGGGSPGGMGRF